ncbi:unnamed protein product [Dicrocoelium dendriticum]|nr:unnamed protein product [Dicrocoelium dendriticum]
MEIQTPKISNLSPRTFDDELVTAVHFLQQQQLASITITRRRINSRSNQRRTRSVICLRGICWYHRRFRNKAKKCVKPCRFSDSENDHAST